MDGGRGVAHASARVSKMAKCCFQFTTALESADLLLSYVSREGDAGRLAALAHRHKYPYLQTVVAG